jgi:uncharacterized membrane protein
MASLQELTRNKLNQASVPQNVGRVGRVLSTIQGDINVGAPERWFSGIGGGLLTFYAFIRRDWIGAILAVLGADFILRGLTGHCYIYQALGISTAGQKNSTSVRHNQGIKVERAVTINKSPGELYRFWRNFENLPRFMEHLKSVTIIDNTHSHWIANAPGGTSVEWDAVIINERENELIAWRSVEGADIGNAGSVHFTPAPGGRGTQVRVVLEYDPPVGRAGAIIARLFGEEPDQQVREDLRHFKEIMEAGEIPTTEGQPSGRSKK